MPPDMASPSAEIDLDDEQYDSAEDEDFQLDAAQDDADSGMSDSDEEEAADEPASKRRKKDTKDAQGADTFVLTQYYRSGEERKPLAKIDGATVDVDALWAKMNAPDSGVDASSAQDESKEATPAAGQTDGETAGGDEATPSAQEPQTKYTEEMVKIKRTYKFAGEMITEEKIVPKDSAEAKLFLAGEKDAETVTAADVDNAANAKDALKLRRPLRRPSRFDPNPTGSIKKSWEKQPVTEATAGQENARGPKINTVEKSRLDWAAYVDQAGIKDELNVHSKAKEGFLGRMDFLDRVGAKIDEERRNARLKGL
ncbi:SRP19 family protein [Aspergillus niger]|uniref:SWR1-complex protein 5 n=1 Tax=Aspergillus niger TaxID=5061 RepID=A0A505IIK5_ASPNG|nr:SRP19 family protein [Aspergillus niger]